MTLRKRLETFSTIAKPDKYDQIIESVLSISKQMDCIFANISGMFSEEEQVELSIPHHWIAVSDLNEMKRYIVPRVKYIEVDGNQFDKHIFLRFHIDTFDLYIDDVHMISITSTPLLESFEPEIVASVILLSGFICAKKRYGSEIITESLIDKLASNFPAKKSIALNDINPDHLCQIERFHLTAHWMITKSAKIKDIRVPFCYIWEGTYKEMEKAMKSLKVKYLITKKGPIKITDLIIGMLYNISVEGKKTKFADVIIFEPFGVIPLVDGCIIPFVHVVTLFAIEGTKKRITISDDVLAACRLFIESTKHFINLPVKIKGLSVPFVVFDYPPISSSFGTGFPTISDDLFSFDGIQRSIQRVDEPKE